jgi:hypothetical protein
MHPTTRTAQGREPEGDTHLAGSNHQVVERGEMARKTIEGLCDHVI